MQNQALAPNYQRTALYNFHLQQGAKIVPFAGYELPIQYKEGIVAEHLHTRASASLFDVSHMGTVLVKGAGITDELEKIIPSDLHQLARGKICYSVLLNDQGGIIDDLMITKVSTDNFSIVINGACKDKDMAYLKANLPAGSCTLLSHVSLLALQGPKAVDALSALIPDVKNLYFLEAGSFTWKGHSLTISRSGYTGEDGFEILVPDTAAVELATLLCSDEKVKCAGLGARDSLRLEAGLCLYGQDLDETRTPVEAGIGWIIHKRRRAEGGFKGHNIIQQQLQKGAAVKRIALLPEGKVMVRTGAELCDENGKQIGIVTSGSFTPVSDRPIAMGYVETAHATTSTFYAKVRGELRPCALATLPFHPTNYVKR